MKANQITEKNLINNFRDLADNQKKELFDFLFFLKFHKRKRSKSSTHKTDLLSFEGILEGKTKLNSIDLQQASKKYWSEKYVSD